MQFFCGKNRGAISVFLTMILLPVIVFSGIIVDASRLYASKTVISGAADLTMNAALAAYDKELKNSYGLFAMADRPDSEKMKESLEQYFIESCNAFYMDGKDNGDFHSIIQLELGGGEVSARGVNTSSLASAHVLQQQILEYMKFRGPVYMVSDILEKFQKMPLKNIEEKKEYIDAKADYGKEASRLGDPLKKAKEYVERHGEAVGSMNTTAATSITSMTDHLREQSVFWLAARSLESYLSNNTLAPMGNGTISPELVRSNLAGCVIWSESQTVFSDTSYADLIAAVSLYQLRDSLGPQMTEENGFSEEEISSYNNINSVIRQSISNMDKIYDSVVTEYKAALDTLKQETDTIIDAGYNGIEQLEKLIELWEKDVQKAKDKCNDKMQALNAMGEDTSTIQEVWEQEEIKINVEDARRLIGVLESNIQAAKNIREQISELESVPGDVRNQYLYEGEGKLILELGYKEAVRQFWSNHQLGQDISISFNFQDVYQDQFYIDTLMNVAEGAAEESSSAKKEDEMTAAQNSQDQYGNILNALETAQKEKNLEDNKEFSYPSEFPSGFAKVLPDITGSRKTDKIDISGDDVSDVSNVSDSMDGIGQLLARLDTLSGELLERAYLMEYMTEMFNCLTTKDEVTLSDENLSDHYIYNGEMEYILYGNPNTVVNKLNSVSVLFSLRLAVNSVYVFFDKTINAEADTVASGVCTVTGQMWLYPIVKYGYMFCRAVIMSGEDIVKLTKGEAAAVWPGDEKFTLTYKEYMKLFILIALMGNNGEDKLVSRTGDCIQMNTGKKLSEMYTMLTMEAEVKSTTTFLPRIPAFLGETEGDDDGKKVIRYKGVLAY